jgi:hypothetical protein
MFGHHRSISRASLLSPFFNIRFLAPETRFDVAETGFDVHRRLIERPPGGREQEKGAQR